MCFVLILLAESGSGCCKHCSLAMYIALKDIFNIFRCSLNGDALQINQRIRTDCELEIKSFHNFRFSPVTRKFK